MAAGLGGTWGQRTEFDPNRGVSRDALPQSTANKFYYQESKTAADVESMSDDEWAPISRDGLIDRGRVVDYMRALENYKQS
jgi:hypothetical protein